MSTTRAGWVPGDLTDELIGTSVWSEDLLQRAGIPIVDVPFVTVGGGIGSFVTVDLLRIAGIPIEQIKVLTDSDAPWQRYQYLTRASQIPVHERIRSDSSSIPDNFWGFPSLAWREARQDKTLAPLWNVLTEPVLCNYWTPKAGTIFDGLAKEAQRIRWFELVAKGQVRMVRKRAAGGYFTILTPPEGVTATKRIAYRSQFVHLAVGYPGLQFLDDLEEYRQTYGDVLRVVNAYEPHEHVYDELNRRPGAVVIRGAGIVASRVLQRLCDDRENNGAQTTIVHLFRTYVDGPHGHSIFWRRKGADGWAYQGFNYPKSAWGGQLWKKMRHMEGPERAQVYDWIGGTNTPVRKSWQRQLAQGRREGWYRTQVGSVESVVPSPDGQLVITRMRDKKSNAILEVPANAVIDCTGLEADIGQHRVYADLMEHSGAGRNVKNRLDVERTFEVRGTRSGTGRLYASGSMTLGGYFPGVDTFLGLQLAAVDIVDDLAAAGFGNRIGVGRSISQWWKRMKGAQI